MSGDEGRALGRRDFRMFEAILPLIDRPSVEIVFGELREDLVEVDLPVAERAVARRALQPGLVSGIEALFAGRAKLGVFHVKALDALMVDVDERDIVQPLLDEVARVIVDVAAGMIADRRKKLLERLPVENVLARVQLEPNVDAGFVEGVKDGRPTPTKFLEGGFNEMVRTLRPGIAIGPGKRAGEGLRDLEAQASRRLRGGLSSPRPPRPGALSGFPHAWRRESVADGVISRMHGDKLTLKSGHQFGDRRGPFSLRTPVISSA